MLLLICEVLGQMLLLLVDAEVVDAFGEGLFLSAAFHVVDGPLAPLVPSRGLHTDSARHFSAKDNTIFDG